MNTPPKDSAAGVPGCKKMVRDKDGEMRPCRGRVVRNGLCGVHACQWEALQRRYVAWFLFVRRRAQFDALWEELSEDGDRAENIEEQWLYHVKP